MPINLLAEIDEVITLLEATIPANPNSPKNLRHRKRLEKGLRDYFNKLENAFPYSRLEKLYNRYVVEEAMTPADWKAEYKKGTPHWAEDMKPSGFAEDFVKTMGDNKVESILEVGCGNGRDSILFASSGYQVTSIDIVPKAVEMARANAKKAGEVVTFKVANVEKLPFDDGEFGAIFTLSVLHSTDLDKSIPEVARVLKSDGVAFIYIYGDTQFEDNKPKEITITFHDYIKALKEAGFKVLKSYIEQEDEFDEFGEKHSIFVVLLQKGENDEA